jgi:hypothetical protein
MFGEARSRSTVHSHSKRGTALARALGIILCVLMVVASVAAPSAQAAIKRHMVFGGCGPGECGLWSAEAEPDGYDPKSLGWSPGSSKFSISPDGRTIAWSQSNTVRLADISGNNLRTAYRGPGGHLLFRPSFSPDGARLIFTEAQFLSGWTFAIETINVDGTGLRTIANNGEFFAEPNYSSDGRTITYSIENEESNAIVVADADGSNPRTVIEAGGELEWVIQPNFSPDGRQIVFSAAVAAEEEAEEAWEVFTADADGENILRVTRYEGYTHAPKWTSDGTGIDFEREVGEAYVLVGINPEGTTAEYLQPIEDFEFSYSAAFSQVSAAVDDDTYLGANFAPLLRFDEEELWRPLTVEEFLQEPDPEEPEDGYNEICNEVGCYDILPRAWRASLWASMGLEPPRYIKMGRLPRAEYPTTPYEGCYLILVVDCSAGPRAAIYYHVAPSATANERTEGGYNYVDYWMFYRYNAGPFGVGDHEGDWEGITIAPTPEKSRTFDLVIFAQHSNHTVYAASLLECDAGGRESCGTEEEPSGQRVVDYVAQGTHASYPEEDNGGELELCFQYEEILPEGCHDGAIAWGGNHEPSNVKKLPNANGWEAEETANWVDWPGKWGSDEDSPDSPGAQDRYTCPWESSPLDEGTACPARTHRAGGQRARNRAVSACSNWFGSGIAIATCSRPELRRAVRRGKMGSRGRLSVVSRMRGRRSASVPGITQTLGAPLKRGERIVLSGHAAQSAELLARARVGRRLLTARFTALGFARGGHGTLVAGSHRGRPTLSWIRPNGRLVNPDATRTAKLPRGWRPARTAHHERRAQSRSGRPSARTMKACRSIVRRYQRRLWLARRQHTHPTRRSAPPSAWRC